MNHPTSSTQLAILGAGPGGYAAAFRAADLGLQVTLIDLEKNPGGVCLYKGCIPSKALLHVSKIIQEAKSAQEMGIYFQQPELNLDRIRAWKESVVQKMTEGLGALCKARKINWIQGRASFTDAHHLNVDASTLAEPIRLSFESAIIAPGSRPLIPPEFAIESPNLWSSTRALNLEVIPKTLLVIGGGYIGLELGSVFASLGTEVTVVEMASRLLPEADEDLARVLIKKTGKIFTQVHTNTKVIQVEEVEVGLKVAMENEQGKEEKIFEKVLVSIGRVPNSSGLGISTTGVLKNDRGFVSVDLQRRTNIPHLFAIGDITGQPMLAHKATHEGIVAAEVIAGKSSIFDPRAIPAVIYTDPEIAWCGLNEAQAKKEKIEVQISRFPWSASGRATTLNASEGMTKILTDPSTQRILGMGLVGPNAGELIAEGVLAIEMGATAEDLALSIHPHPTLSETLMEAAEGISGMGLHVYRPKKK